MIIFKQVSIRPDKRLAFSNSGFLDIEEASSAERWSRGVVGGADKIHAP
jgi:hypothetical protein